MTNNPNRLGKHRIFDMTASPGSITYNNDILGNRTSKTGSISYEWDQVNRMKKYVSGTSSYYYTYRADGMRVKLDARAKDVDYSYDGQMPIEEYTTGKPGQTGIKVIRKGASFHPVPSSPTSPLKEG